MRGVQHLYHDPVVQTGETCCASDMTEYEKRIKNNILRNGCSLRFAQVVARTYTHTVYVCIMSYIEYTCTYVCIIHRWYTQHVCMYHIIHTYVYSMYYIIHTYMLCVYVSCTFNASKDVRVTFTKSKVRDGCWIAYDRISIKIPTYTNNFSKTMIREIVPGTPLQQKQLSPPSPPMSVRSKISVREEGQKRNKSKKNSS